MPERFALKISEELLAMAATVTGGNTSPFEEDSYIIIEPISNTKFTLEIMPEESVFEEFKKDNKLHIL